MRTFGSFLASALLVLAVGCGSDNGTSVKLDGGSGKLDGAVTPGGNLDAEATPDAPATNPGVDAPATNPGIDAPATTPVDGAVSGVDGAVVSGVDGGTVIDGGKAIDGGAASTCTMPSCMASLGGNCVPSGACVIQQDLATLQSRTCYANGVKMVQQMGTTGVSYTFQNGTAVCYSMSVDLATIMGASGDAGAPLVIPVKNASGTTIATLTVNPTTRETTVTCPGAQPVALDSSCTGALSFSSSATPNNCSQGTCAP